MTEPSLPQESIFAAALERHRGPTKCHVKLVTSIIIGAERPGTKDAGAVAGLVRIDS
jgi:hypothetical protein